MKRILEVRRLAAAVVVSVCCLASSAFAALDMYLDVEGIEGTSQEVPGAIDVLAYSWGVSNSGSTHTGGGGGVGKANFQDLSVTIATSKATPKLLEACATGMHIPQATLTARKAGGKQTDYLEIKLETVLVSSYSTGGNEGDSVHIENLSLNFAKVTFTYFSGGEPFSFTFNIAENTTQ